MDQTFSLLFRAFPLLLKGSLLTLEVLLIAALLSFMIGLLFGVLTCQHLRIPILSSVIDGITFVYRAVPFFVQLLIVYFVLPDVFGFTLGPFTASVIALGSCSSGYIAQIVRAGINSISIEQWESAFILGYSKLQTLRYVILPQMLRNVLPAFNNELDSLLKSTAIVSSIGMLELTRMGMNLVSTEMQPVPIYISVAFIYLCMSGVINMITRKLERKIAYVKR